jgi:hypothetical protein
LEGRYAPPALMIKLTETPEIATLKVAASG